MSSATFVMACMLSAGSACAQAPQAEHTGDRPLARCFTLPQGWCFTSAALPILRERSSERGPVPSGEFVAVVSGYSPETGEMPTPPPERVTGLIAIGRSPAGELGIRWNKYLGAGAARAELAGGRDLTGAGDPEVLICLSPSGESRNADGVLMLASCTDGALRGTRTVPSTGLVLGRGVLSKKAGFGVPACMFVEATAWDTPGKVFAYGAAGELGGDVLGDLPGGGMLYPGLLCLDRSSDNEPLGGQLIVHVADSLSDTDHFPRRYRTIAVDLQTHEQRVLDVARQQSAMCLAPAPDGSTTDDVMIAEVCEDAGGECVWLELRRTSTRTGQVVQRSTFPLDDDLGPGRFLLPSWFWVSIDTLDDVDADGTADYVCRVACTCDYETWRVLIVSGATGALLGRIDDALLGRVLGPDWTLHVAPQLFVPLGIGTAGEPEIAVGCGREPHDDITSIAVLRLSECVSRP